MESTHEEIMGWLMRGREVTRKDGLVFVEGHATDDPDGIGRLSVALTAGMTSGLYERTRKSGGVELFELTIAGYAHAVGQRWTGAEFEVKSDNAEVSFAQTYAWPMVPAKSAATRAKAFALGFEHGMLTLGPLSTNGGFELKAIGR